MLEVTPTSAEGQPRGRTSSKARSGCITCKKRKVKCDERRPLCARCEKASIDCAGYVNFISNRVGAPRPQSQQQSSQIISTDSTKNASTRVKDIYIFYRGVGVLPGLKSDEIDAFDYCRKCTLAELDSMEWIDLWQSAIPAASHSEPAIFHALSALGSAHRAFTQRQDRRAPSDNNLVTRSYSQYGKAVHNLQKRLRSAQEPPIAVVLIACFVLLTFDIVSERYTSALSHLRHAGNIIQTLQYNNISNSQPPSEAHPTELLDKLAWTFHKLSTHAPSWGGDAEMFGPFTNDTKLASVSDFKTSHEASSHLTPTMQRAVAFALKQDRLRSLQPPVIDQFASEIQSQILSELSCWHDALQASGLLTSASHSTNSNSKDTSYRVALLEMHYALSVLMVTTCADRYNEMLHDTLLPIYNTILTNAAAILPRFPSLYLDRTIIQPLYATATHCRHRLIRRQALHLLKQVDHLHRWDTRILVACATEVIRYEEGAAGLIDTGNEDDGIGPNEHFRDAPKEGEGDLATLIPPHARVCEAEGDVAGSEMPAQGFVRVVLKSARSPSAAAEAAAAASPDPHDSKAGTGRNPHRDNRYTPNLSVVHVRTVPLGSWSQPPVVHSLISTDPQITGDGDPEIDWTRLDWTRRG